MNTDINNITNYETDRAEKKKELFLRQKETLDIFLQKGAISKAQYDKSFGDLVVKMGMEKEVDELNGNL